MYSYKIFRLIIIAIIITYFVGCFWYLVSSSMNSDQDMEISFVGKYFDSQDTPIYDRLIMCCYFALTTLSTVGYGDMTP